MRSIQAEKESVSDVVNLLEKRMNTLEIKTVGAKDLAGKAKKRATEAYSAIERIQPESDTYTSLEGDIFTLMTTKEILSPSWWFGLTTFFLQIALLILIFKYQLSEGEENSTFGVPFSVGAADSAAQIFAILVSIMLSTDVVMPIKEMSMLRFSNREEWVDVIGKPNADWKDWVKRILLPNFLKFCEGLFVLLISFVIIVQSDNVIILFKDFAAMQLIAEIDNVAFWLANQGYFGSNIKDDTIQAKKVRVKDEVARTCFGLPLGPIVLLLLFLFMLAGFVLIMYGQKSGAFFRDVYPSCPIKQSDIVRIGDGKCDGGVFNTVQCGFDGGDCIQFRMSYPDCDVPVPSKINDGICQIQYNTTECKFDGGDCK
jgi:hypothetical protein